MQITIDGNEQVAAAYIGAMCTDIDKSFMLSGQFSPVRICKDGVIKILMITSKQKTPDEKHSAYNHKNNEEETV